MRTGGDVVILQHLPIEHPGMFREFMREDGLACHTVELDAGEAIPDLRDFRALLVMGGPMDVWQEGPHPWLRDEKAALREAVRERRMPVLGVCLGHQLLAAALGGDVGPGRVAEVGLMEVDLTEAGKQSPFFAGLPERITCLQWHGAEVRCAPEDAHVLASSPGCSVQAMSIDGVALGIQFHVEVTPAMVSEWAKVPAYAAALERTLGAGAVPKLERDAARHRTTLAGDARTIYQNFRRLFTMPASSSPR
jgi:GMP synthase-like glutamine amidotransferase